MELELAPALPVHVVDQAAGERLEQQAEDGHAGAEALRVPDLLPWVEDADVDDVQEDGDCQANQELQGEPAQGPAVTSPVGPATSPSPSRHGYQTGSPTCALLCASLASAGNQQPDGTARLGQGLGLDPARGPTRAPTTSCRP